MSPAEDEGVSPIALSQRLQAALHSIAPPPHNGISPLEPKDAAKYLLAGHHPKTTLARARSASAWYAASEMILQDAICIAISAVGYLRMTFPIVQSVLLKFFTP